MNNDFAVGNKVKVAPGVEYFSGATGTIKEIIEYEPGWVASPRDGPQTSYIVQFDRRVDNCTARGFSRNELLDK